MGLYALFSYLLNLFFGIDRYTQCPYLYDTVQLIAMFATVVSVKLILDVPLVLVRNWKQKLKGEQ